MLDLSKRNFYDKKDVYAVLSIVILCMLSFLLIRCAFENLGTPKYESNDSIIVNPIYVRGAELRTVSIVRSGGLSNFNVELPEIFNFSDSNIVNANRTIHDFIVTYGKLHEVSYNLFGFKDSWIDIDISYEVTYASDELLSLHFFGAMTGGGLGARGFIEIQKAITIDVDSGNILTLGDFFSYEEMQAIIENLLVNEKSFLMGRYANMFGYTVCQWELDMRNEIRDYLAYSLFRGDLLSNTRYFYIRENRVGLIAHLLFPIDTIVVEVTR